MPECVSAEKRIIGSRQYPPRMMLALVIYCDANGQMFSRRIERAMGLLKVRIEWDLACLAYNVTRIWRLTKA
jgi:hypothetical protein